MHVSVVVYHAVYVFHLKQIGRADEGAGGKIKQDVTGMIPKSKRENITEK